MDEAQTDPRRRMNELRAIPEGQRTDAQWDELNELEISLHPGNRIGAEPPGRSGGFGPSPGSSGPRRQKKFKPQHNSSPQPRREGPPPQQQQPPQQLPPQDGAPQGPPKPRMKRRPPKKPPQVVKAPE